MNRRGHHWEHYETHRALRLFRRGVAFSEIALISGRTEQATRDHLAKWGARPRREELPPGGGRVVRYVDPIARVIPAEVMEERDRAYGSDVTTIHRTLLGDPPPGRSALDRLKGGRM